MTWVEIFAVIANIIYVLLAAKENALCWPFGIIGAVLWSYAAYFTFNLQIDALMQLYYVLIAIYGWYEWNKGTTVQKVLKISKLSIKEHFIIIIGGFVLTFLVGYFFDKYTSAAATYLDAFTTVFSIITTYLVTRKILENWLYWIVIDAAYVYLYYSRGGYLFVFLNIVFIIVAIIGYRNWLRADAPKFFTSDYQYFTKK